MLSFGSDKGIVKSLELMERLSSSTSILKFGVDSGELGSVFWSTSAELVVSGEEGYGNDLAAVFVVALDRF